MCNYLSEWRIGDNISTALKKFGGGGAQPKTIEWSSATVYVSIRIVFYFSLASYLIMYVCCPGKSRVCLTDIEGALDEVFKSPHIQV
jgi:hypothetical protein